MKLTSPQTLFSTGFFDWKGGGDGPVIISPYIWVLGVVSVVLTLLTMGTFFACTMNQKGGDDDSDEKIASMV